MKKNKVYYTIEKHNGIWTVWKNAEGTRSCGCYGLFSGTLTECRSWSSENKIRIKGGKFNIRAKMPSWRELWKRRFHA